MAVSTIPRLRRVALAGNPNVGKTTVFNLLTGLNQKVANYPGVTVERKVGRLVGSKEVDVVDLPGTYSLNPKSLDERVAYDVLVGRMKGERAPDVVVCVVDATNLQRNLYLVSQIIDLGLPVVVALNMMDAAEEEGTDIDVERLSEELGSPVVPISARKRRGIDKLIEAIHEADEVSTDRKWALIPAVQSVVERLSNELAEEASHVDDDRRFFEALGALTSDALLDPWRERAPGFTQSVLEARDTLTERKVPFRQAETMGRYGWISPLVSRVVTRRKPDSERTLSDRLDAVLTHRIAGPAIFAGILVLIFQAIFTWAVPFMDAIEAGVGIAGQAARSVLPAGIIEDMVVEGAIAGVGNVIVFLPQILLLFFFLGLMEDTGYMARTSFIMDRMMRRMGLSGGSVVPLLSGYACAIPAIMAARTLDSERDRLITIMVVPLMSCSARLPVYTLFIAAFIPAGTLFGFMGYQGLAMFSMYLLGTVMAFAAAWVLKTFVFKSESSMFVMELPPYRAPQLKQVFRRMVDRSKIFVVRAGKIILGMSILLWFLASYPKVDPDPALEAERIAVQDQIAEQMDESPAPSQTPSAEQPFDEPGADASEGQPDGSEELFGDAPEGQFADAPEEQIGDAPEEQIGDAPEEQIGDAPEGQLGNAPEEQIGDAPKGQLGNASEVQSDDASEGQFDEAPRSQTNDIPEPAERLAEIGDAQAAYQVRHSFIGKFGRALEPIMQPLGFDWKITAGIISSFAAREVIVSALATIYSVGRAEEGGTMLREALKADTYPNGEPVYTPLVAVSLMVFFVFALQCMSTLAIARRETGSWFWPSIMWLYMFVLAWVFSFVVYQGGMILGWGVG